MNCYLCIYKSKQSIPSSNAGLREGQRKIVGEWHKMFSSGQPDHLFVLFFYKLRYCMVSVLSMTSPSTQLRDFLWRRKRHILKVKDCTGFWKLSYSKYNPSCPFDVHTDTHVEAVYKPRSHQPEDKTSLSIVVNVIRWDGCICFNFLSWSKKNSHRPQGASEFVSLFFLGFSAFKERSTFFSLQLSM